MLGKGAGTSNSAVARLLGVSETAVRKAEKIGRIKREPDGSWDLEKVSLQWKKNTDPSKKRTVATLDDDVTFTEARTKDMLLRVQMRELDLRERQGALVDKDEYDKKVFALARQFRDAVQNWPTRVAPEMAAELGVDQHQVSVTLGKFIRDLLTDLASVPVDLE